jgi:hypothetical protein
MQNRESAVRSRQKKKESVEYLKSENDILKKENYHLLHENSYLKKEKNFLIDQIKFMQNLIKSNGMLVQQNTCANDIEKNVSVNNNLTKGGDATITLNGERQKPFAKIFSVFLICVLSVFYVSFNESDVVSNEKIVFRGGSTITLNDDSDRIDSSNKNKSFMIFSPLWLDLIIKVLIIVLVTLIVLNVSHLWNWVKKKFENNKKLYKNL